MKFILLFFVFIIFLYPQKIAAQVVYPPFSRDISKMATVDSGNIRVWYAFNAVDINRFETYDDLQRLDIGSHISKYYSEFVYQSDSLTMEWGKTHRNSNVGRIIKGKTGKNAYWSEYYWSEYFKDISNGLFSEYVTMPMFMVKYNCQYSEKVHIQNWEVYDDTLTVAGYMCQKAGCSFRGRNYTAWFTVDIPVNNGPWKFGGLPGLILKVYDDRMAYIFECVKIKFYDSKYPVQSYCYDGLHYNKMERNKLLNLLKKIHEDYHGLLGAIVDGPPRKKNKLTYYPLELE
jgi:GLPGLI family protein